MVPFFAPPCMYSVHASSSQLLNVSSRLKSTQVDMLLSSRVESDVLKSTAVDFGVILASSRVKFLYRSDSQVYFYPHPSRTSHVTNVNPLSLGA